MDTWKVTCQDGRQFEAELNKDGTLDWEITHEKEWYYLNVDDGTGETICVGVYYDMQDARDAAEEMERSGVVPYQEISAVDYLESDGEDITPADARELQGVDALQYINGDKFTPAPADFDDVHVPETITQHNPKITANISEITTRQFGTQYIVAAQFGAIPIVQTGFTSKADAKLAVGFAEKFIAAVRAEQAQIPF